MEEEPSTSGGIKRSIPKELQDKMDETAAKIPRVTGIYNVFNNYKMALSRCLIFPKTVGRIMI